MNFSQLQGNENIKTQLIRMVEQQAIGHALLFVGPEGIGKSLFAQALAQFIWSREPEGERHASKLASGHHPDFHAYHPEGKLGMHPIHSLRQLNEEVNLPPYEAKWKFFVIHEANRMLSYSANALLKTFEEPPPNTLIILLAQTESSLLPTILSRCRIVRFQPLASAVIENYLETHDTLEPALLQQIVNQAHGSLGRAIRLAHQKGDRYRQLILRFLAHGPVGNYRTLQEVTQQLNTQVEEIKKEVEEASKHALYQVPKDQLSLQQHQALEKELEGLVTLAQMQEAQLLLEHVLEWYRDLNYLLIGGQASGLTNPDFREELEQAIQRQDYHSLEFAQQAVDEAYASLQRSTSLSLCLETLFLKLERII